MTPEQVKAIRTALLAAPATPPQTGDEFLSAVRTALGLGNDATPGETLAALQALLNEDKTETAALAALQALLNEDKTETAALSAPAGNIAAIEIAFRKVIEPLTARVEGFETTIKALSTNAETREREEIEQSAIREGKELPPMAKTLSVPQLRELVTQLPVTVPLNARTPLEGQVALHARTAQPAIGEATMQSLGLSAEDVTKYAPKI